ncbi:MAG: sulfotransferase [Bacteroidota bacterium]
MNVRKPYRPVPIKIINGIGGSLKRLGLELPKITSERLLKAAQKQTGLTDFGDPYFRSGLDQLVDAIQSEANLNQMGRIIAWNGLLRGLVNRLKMTEHVKQHPQVLQEEIRKPLFIIGLPRTGTTILHTLLSQDSGNRSPLGWEVNYPAPPPTPETYFTDPRIAQTQKDFDNFEKLVPGFQAMHLMTAVHPQECLAIFAYEFYTLQYAVQFDIPSYLTMLTKMDKKPLMEKHKYYLQFLQSGGMRGDRWLLKTPDHLNALDAIFHVYPDANIIQTHRDPVTVMASISSLAWSVTSITTDNLHPYQLAKMHMDYWENLMNAHIEQRERHKDKPKQFFDMTLQDLVKDPIAAVERIYDYFDYDLKPEVKNKMSQFMKDNPKGKHGEHKYTPEEFGIDSDKERPRFEAYMKYFNL